MGNQSEVRRDDVEEWVGQSGDAEEGEGSKVIGEFREGECHGDDLDQSLSGENATDGTSRQVESASKFEGKRGSRIGFGQAEQYRKKLFGGDGVAVAC